MPRSSSGCSSSILVIAPTASVVSVSSPADSRHARRATTSGSRARRARSPNFQDAQAFKEANGFFRDANKLAPDDADINAAWGELFLDKHNPADAMKSFSEALRVDGNHVDALIGAAQVNAGMNPPAARAALERALKVNPNSVPAHLLQAELALDDRERDAARESIKKALSVNPNSLEARSLDAAIARLDDQSAEFEKRSQEVLKINPNYGEVYRVAGDHLARNYRFDEAVELVQRAITLDPDNTRAYSDLGTHLLRTGDEKGARVALERAFKGDSFDQTTFNQLDLLDTIDKFVTITDGDIIMRLDPAEVGVMREYAMPLAKQALATLQKQYEFKVTGPILIEMFPKHDRLRRAHDRAAGHHRRARRMLRPRRHARFAERARPRGVPLGRDAVARDRPRHHAADVEEPPAALAQ